MVQFNNNEQLDALVKEAAKVKSSTPGFINVVNFNDYVEQGKQMEPPVEFFKHVIVENEVTIFFGDTGVGKSIFALQMANEVAMQGKRVMYVNFELSQQQWAKRYPSKQFPSTLSIANIDYSKMHDVTDQALILDEIQRRMLENDIEVVFIDNLTNLCVNSKDGNEAGNIMLKLLSLRMNQKLTMVVIAHVPKRKAGDPYSLNDLAGSKVLSNYADNVVAINKSKKDKSMRYLIQLKFRSFPIELDCKNVQELMMTESDGWLHFEYGGYSEETEHLPRSRDEKVEMEREILKELKVPNGLSYRDIADKVGTSLGMVQRVAKNYGLCRKAEKNVKK